MGSDAFENVRGQIGYCGIWCGSCAAGNGALRELTGRYLELVKGYGLEGWAPGDFDYGEFSRGLASIQGMPLCEGCLRGDGKPGCRMRECARGRGVPGCAECGGEGCGNREPLEAMRGGALAAGLMVKTEAGDPEGFIERRTPELKDSWPSRILFQRRARACRWN